MIISTVLTNFLVPHRTAFYGTCIAAMLAIVAWAIGLFGHHIYLDNDFVQTVWQANDLVTLFTAFTTAALVLFTTKTATIQLLWAGLLSYLIYTYAFYLFGAAFNSLFLVYVGVILASLVALLALLVGLPVRQFSLPTALARFMGGYLFLIALMLVVVELPPAVGFIFTGALPDIVLKTAHPTSVVYALDLTLVVPTCLVATVWLWQQKPWGVVLAAIMLVKSVAYGLVLCAGTLLLAYRGIDHDPLLPFYVFITLGGLVGSVSLWRTLRTDGQWTLVDSALPC